MQQRSRALRPGIGSISKALLASPAVALLGLGVTACGGASKGAGAVARNASNAAAASPAQETIPLEAPNSAEDNGDDMTIFTYGHAASAADRRAIAAVVGRYYAAVAAEDGASACSLMPARVARAVPQEWGRPGPGPPYMKGKTCAGIMSKMFIHFHSQLTDVPRVSGVRVKGASARALLRSSTLPFIYTTLRREGGAWRIGDLLGARLP
ncbi:MAG TPA: hypothetical protein VFV03_00190 [Solirubrobacteraceae bacterium]|nr:hypothetical protein [Solirubrobacteraceae bacterium]